MTPEQLDALWQRGQQLEAQGMLDAARDSYVEILAGSPRQFMVQIRLSELEQQAGRYGAARARALQAADTLAQTMRWEGLSYVTSNLLVFDERERVLALILQAEWSDERIIRQSPVLSQQLWLCGREKDSLRLLDIAERRVQGDHRLAYSRGIALQHLGQMAGASAALEESIKRSPEFALAHWSLAYHESSNPPGSRVERIRAVASRTHEPMEQAMLHYALYKELDAANQLDAAWSELSAGAAIMRDMVGGQGSASTAGMDALLAEVPSSQGDGAGVPEGPRPIFVVGMPRTGTTLLSRILGAHPAVMDAGEINAVEHAVAEGIDRFVALPMSPMVLAEAACADPVAIAAAYSRRTQGFHSGGATYVLDKNPSNVFAAGIIARAMPGARIVCLVRGAMDTCYSNLRQLFQNGAFAYSYDQLQLAEHYAAFRRVAAHWSRQLPNNFLEVGYEELVRDPMGVGERVMAFCGLDFDPAYADITRNVSPSATASASQVRQPIHTDGIGEWRRYEQALRPLAARLSELGIEP